MRLWPASFTLCALCRLFVYAFFICGPQFFGFIFFFGSSACLRPENPVKSRRREKIRSLCCCFIKNCCANEAAIWYFASRNPRVVHYSQHTPWRDKSGILGTKLINFCFWLKRNQNEPNLLGRAKTKGLILLRASWGCTRTCVCLCTWWAKDIMIPGCAPGVLNILNTLTLQTTLMNTFRWAHTCEGKAG